VSAPETLVRDVVMDRIRELRSEMRQLEISLGNLEHQLQSQPLAKHVELGTELRAIEGWFETMMENLTLIDLCDEGGGDTSHRLSRFAKKLAASVNYWRRGASDRPLAPA
jgi:hypothetical protein